jgi:endonuclease YncB( thermonuclease family)
MRTGRRILALAVLLRLATSPALGAEITGLVVDVHDGDSLTFVLGVSPIAVFPRIKVRLADIDAPELKQAFGQRSKESLVELCLQKSALLEDQGEDRYGRRIARVRCDGTDANREQVRRGMAWVFDRYVKDRSLYADQDTARAAQRGLWADPKAMPPWAWRRARKAAEVP